MVDLYRRHNPLSIQNTKTADSQSSLRFSFRLYDGKIILQGSPTDEGFTAAAHGALQLSLPQPTASVSCPGLGVLALGPREWLLVTPEGSEQDLYQRLQKILSPHSHGLAIASDALVVITVAGPKARDVLAAGCALDFHPRVFQTSKVVRTLLARTSVIVHRAADQAYDLYIGRSYANYLASWIRSLKLG